MQKTTIDFANSSEQALEQVINIYGYPILRYCHNILCNYHDAQDAVQVTFIKAYNKRHAYKSNMNLSPWLYRIAYTACVDIIRKRKPLLSLDNDLQATEDNYIPDNILQALKTLNLLDRSLIYSRVMEERSYDELAKIHSKTPATLRKRYERARKKLAQILKDDYPYYAKQAQPSKLRSYNE